MMTVKRKTKVSNEREKKGKTPFDPTRPIGKGNPPIETQIQPGQVLNPHGGPRKRKDIQELIKEIMDEDLLPKVNRIKAAIRLGLNRNPIAFIEYAFGKAPTLTHEMDND